MPTNAELHEESLCLRMATTSCTPVSPVLQGDRGAGRSPNVCFASDDVLWTPQEDGDFVHPPGAQAALLQSLATVDGVVMGENLELGLDFQDHFLQLRPDILAVTEDDQYGELKRILCATTGAPMSCCPRRRRSSVRSPQQESYSGIRRAAEAPLRVDFAGGWLDVPRFSRAGGWW